MTATIPERKKKTSSVGGACHFLMIVVLVLVVISMLDPARGGAALHFALGLLVRLIPIMAFVFVLMFVSNLLIRPQWVKAHVGRESGLKGYAIALAGGVFSIGPIYVWFEFLKDMQRKGMRTDLIATFIYARSIKPQLLPLMILYFGWTYTVILEVYLLLFSVLHGWLMGVLPCSAESDQPSGTTSSS